MVGCVIVHKDIIIGEGYTSPFGGPHAEVNAINAVRDPSLLSEATLYVSLEPCSHHGKTPPCADFILESGIKNVVIGIGDPHEKVAGHGIERLRAGGCKVVSPVLEEACREHHRRFLTFHEKKRPYIILKWAQSRDGFLAPDKEKRREDPEPFWITTPLSRQLVHQWRSQEQGILVGAQTVIADDPSLTVRSWTGDNPIRLVWDTEGEADKKAKIFNDEARTVLLSAEKIESENLESISLETHNGKVRAIDIARAIHSLEIQSIIVEGGARTLNSFIEENIWDEARVFTGETTFGSGLRAPKIHGRIAATHNLDGDILTIYRND